MSLDSLIEEIQRRSRTELAELLAQSAREESRIARERDERIASIRSEQERETQVEVARERAQRLAAAKLSARKKVYEARERRLRDSIGAASELLKEFTESDEYGAVLRRMVARAVEAFGRSARISGRAEDGPQLGKLAGKSFDPTPRAISGGIVAETADGKRRLNLSFDELLRLRENRVREILA
ncbi:MAG: hypothetical protein L3J95_03880 [Thermoplasmata archaeon]|nr:hypothetical protein [Thermoplasmata archaeon]MCI4359547.1 hypothetical protein [Thermoplasmata archaeon]